MEIQTIAEQLLFTTVRIETERHLEVERLLLLYSAMNWMRRHTYFWLQINMLLLKQLAVAFSSL